MGAWGTSLYANDASCDIRGDFQFQLRSGKTMEEAMSSILEAYKSTIEDSEDGPLFWFALADTQWNYGRLLPEVKEKALYYLNHREEEMMRWEESDARKAAQWNETLDKLQTKLLSPQPAPKKIYRYRAYHCPWALGDVFLYRLTSEHSKETGCYGKYLAFRKVSEMRWYPVHTIPVVEFYFWMGDSVPALDVFRNIPRLPITCLSATKYGAEVQYWAALICESKRAVPWNSLQWIGNLPLTRTKEEFPVMALLDWENVKGNHKVEAHMLDRYFEWMPNYDSLGGTVGGR